MPTKENSELTKNGVLLFKSRLKTRIACPQQDHPFVGSKKDWHSFLVGARFARTQLDRTLRGFFVIEVLLAQCKQ